MKTYVSPIVGDGKTPDTAYRTKLVQDLIDAGIHCVHSPSTIPVDKAGIPLASWGLTEIDFDRLPIAKGLPEVVGLYQQIMAVGQTLVEGKAETVEMVAVVDQKTADALNAKLAAMGVVTVVAVGDDPKQKLTDELVALAAHAEVENVKL